jgi:hypothetical protein
VLTVLLMVVLMVLMVLLMVRVVKGKGERGEEKEALVVRQGLRTRPQPRPLLTVRVTRRGSRPLPPP